MVRGNALRGISGVGCTYDLMNAFPHSLTISVARHRAAFSGRTDTCIKQGHSLSALGIVKRGGHLLRGVRLSVNEYRQLDRFCFTVAYSRGGFFVRPDTGVKQDVDCIHIIINRGYAEAYFCVGCALC